MEENEDEIRKAKEAKEAPPKVKPLTLMFFFASDNNLSPSMLYQLKSIKAAGSQSDTNVVVHFDPHERGVPSMVFEINKADKNGDKTKIGDYTDPAIRNLAGDQVEPRLKLEESESSSTSGPPPDYDTRTAKKALKHFLRFCRKKYPAKHYMLFLVGHGMVVGRDTFLPDDNPNSGISLVELGKILEKFQAKISGEGVLDLIGMHSCSMSAVEVAYELKGRAKYMIASEGLSFVGAWPYRQMLQKIFNAVDGGLTDDEILPLVKSLYELCVHNSADCIFAGYSSDLCLCTLDEETVKALTGPIQDLATTLRSGLNDDRGEELILLAHLKSQSYFQEAYTDLYDFCQCLSKSCSDSESNGVQQEMKRACGEVIKALTPGGGPILEVDFCGPECQYSYGLSIYFPWVRPIEDDGEHVMRNYKTYAFAKDLQGSSWLEFLTDYFEKTRRRARPMNIGYDREAYKLAKACFKAIGYQVSAPEYATALTGKVNPSDAGGYWSASSIKNYERSLSISERALKVFGP